MCLWAKYNIWHMFILKLYESHDLILFQNLTFNTHLIFGIALWILGAGLMDAFQQVEKERQWTTNPYGDSITLYALLHNTWYFFSRIPPYVSNEWTGTWLEGGPLQSWETICFGRYFLYWKEFSLSGMLVNLLWRRPPLFSRKAYFNCLKANMWYPHSHLQHKIH